MTNEQDRIRGQVATILNTREVALNIGSVDNVLVGMHFNVLDKKIEIIDPESKEVLGTETDIKRQLEITRVEDQYSIASTRHERVNLGGAGLATNMMELYGPPDWVTRYETLKRTDSDHEPLSESASVVKVGDTAVQAPERQTSPPESREEQKEAVQ